MAKLVFTPKYSISDRILHHLTTITASATSIERASLIPKWEVSIRRDALLRNAHASTAIEGNPLSFEQVTQLAEGRNLMVHRKARAEVLNYLTVLEIIPNIARKPLKIKVILDIHQHLMKDVMQDQYVSGEYRKESVVVGNSVTGEIVFRPPQWKCVPALIHALMEWINNASTLRNPILEAGICHYELARIHPFVDGNGRTARALACLILFKRGFDTKRFFALDDFYDSDRTTYYQALKTVNPDSQDLTLWLEYFTEGVMVQIEQVRRRVSGLSIDFQHRERFGQVALNERQMKIIEFIHANGRVSNKNIQKVLHVAPRTAVNIVNELVDLNVLNRVGKGRSQHYVFN